MKPATSSVSWFPMGMLGIFLVSAALRFWGLSRFNSLVFDEVYFAKFANNYLTHTPFFDGHPPLGKYLIAIGIWIGSHLPFGQDVQNALTGSLRSTWSYRWLNALTGSLIPLVVAGIAYQLTYRRSYAFIAALFAAADGIFLVESRYALVNVYLIIFGLLGQWCFLRAGANRGVERWGWLAIAGVWFGASAAIKWNGLWFLFGAYLVWAVAWVLRLLNRDDRRTKGAKSIDVHPLQKLGELNVLPIVINLAIIPALVYTLSWIPHLQLNPEFGLWEVQRQILAYHERVGNSQEVHPYCANWYTWPLMIRPIVYFYQKVGNGIEANPSLPPLPAGASEAIYDVHAMGNPFLWWFSTAAILLLISLLAQRVWVWGERRLGESAGQKIVFPQQAELWTVLYLVLNYVANLLPWVRVTRCTFMYHYMGSSVFAGLAIAWLVDRWLHSYERRFRGIGITVIFAILLAFVFWMPVYLGLPLSQLGWQFRMWFRSWI